VNRSTGLLESVQPTTEGAESALAEVYAGYGYRCNSLYFGGEFFINDAPRSIKLIHQQAGPNNLNPEAATVAFADTDWLEGAYGIRLRPGYFVSCNTLLYVPVGIARNDWHRELNHSDSNVETVTRHLTGGQIGFGIEQAIRSNLSLRLSYLYTGYKQFSENNDEIPTPLEPVKAEGCPPETCSAGCFTDQVQLSPDFTNRNRNHRMWNDQMTLDLSYQFGCARDIAATPATFGCGFYAGIQGGRSTLSDQIHFVNTDLPNDLGFAPDPCCTCTASLDSCPSCPPIPFSNSFSGSGSTISQRGDGGFGELFVGYGRTFCGGFYLGAEASVEGSSQQWEFISDTTPAFAELVTGTTEDDAHYTVDVKRSYGASLLPGYFISSNTMLYGRVGYKRSRFEEKFDQQGYPHLDIDEDISGLRLGVGLQTSLSCHLSLRAEFSHTNYENLDWLFSRDASVFSDDPRAVVLAPFVEEHHKDNTSQFSVGLVWTI
jgi:opacity protein-like surface antigen